MNTLFSKLFSSLLMLGFVSGQHLFAYDPPGNVQTSDGDTGYAFVTDTNTSGVANLAVYGTSSGEWKMQTVDGTEIMSGVDLGGSGYIPVPGDYDGDGTNDMTVYGQASGTWYAQTIGESSILDGASWGGVGFVPVSGDFDGDGTDDLAVYGEADGSWYIRTVAGSTLAYGTNFGGAGYVPVSGDYDGDGADDLGVYHEPTGKWYLRTLSGTTIVNGERWGGPGFTPVSGDFNGDGRSDMTVYDVVEGKWYSRTPYGTNIMSGFAWGGSGYTPVSGDFNGDGASDPAVYDGNDGSWYICTTGSVSILYGEKLGGLGYSAVDGAYAGKPAGMIPVYRLYSYGSADSTYEHLWTTSLTERNTLNSWPSWTYEGVAWQAVSSQSSDAIPLYRLYCSTIKQHHYTTDTNEYNSLSQSGTWSGEGAQYYVWPCAAPGRKPVYRFYQAGTGCHHFTLSEDEKTGILEHPEWGWTYEGIAFYVYEDESPDFTPGTVQQVNILSSGEALIDAARAPDGTLGFLHSSFTEDSDGFGTYGPLYYQAIDNFGNTLCNDKVLLSGEEYTSDSYPRMTFDSNSRPHIFIVRAVSNVFHVARSGFDSWQTESIGAWTFTDGTYDMGVVVRTAPDGSIHLITTAYRIETETLILHITNNSGSWNSEVTSLQKSATMKLYGGQDMAIDRFGYVHIVLSYQDVLSQDVMWPGYMYYLSNNSGTWASALVSYVSNSSWDACYMNPAIRTDNNGYPAIAAHLHYNVLTGSDALSELVYFTQSGGTWVMTVLADVADNYFGTDGGRFTGLYPSFDFDSYNYAHIAFSDLASSHVNGYEQAKVGQIRYATSWGGAWGISTLYSQSESNGEETGTRRLLVSPDGAINILAQVYPGYYIVHFSTCRR